MKQIGRNGYYLLLALMLGHSGISQAAPQLTLKISSPTSSAPAQAASIFKSMPWAPCLSAKTKISGTSESIDLEGTIDDNPLDVLTFSISAKNEDRFNNTTGRALPDGYMDNDLYIFFMNPNASGSVEGHVQHTKIWAVRDTSFYYFSNPLIAILDSNRLPDVNDMIFRKAEDFFQADFRSNIFAESINLERLPQGVWLVVAAFINPRSIKKAADFVQPQNWAAWDAKPFLLGTPFPSTTLLCN